MKVEIQEKLPYRMCDMDLSKNGIYKVKNPNTQKICYLFYDKFQDMATVLGSNFFSISDNFATWEVLEELNDKPVKLIVEIGEDK